MLHPAAGHLVIESAHTRHTKGHRNPGEWPVTGVRQSPIRSIPVAHIAWRIPAHNWHTGLVPQPLFSCNSHKPV